MKHLFLVLALFLSLPSAHAQTVGRPSKSVDRYANGLVVIDRFTQVEEGFYRGAFPESVEQMETLKAYKIKTIITLSNNEEKTKVERTLAKRLGLKLIEVPMHGWKAPTLAQTEKVQALLNDQSLRPLFIHCKHGRERTGVEIALYRQRSNGWTGEAAYAEAKAMGFRPIAWNFRIYLKRALGLID